MIEVKATNTRKRFLCTNKDKIMFNGTCYQLITQSFFKDWSNIIPVISKTEINRLIKQGVLSAPYVVKRTIEVTMYDFNIKEGIKNESNEQDESAVSVRQCGERGKTQQAKHIQCDNVK